MTSAKLEATADPEQLTTPKVSNEETVKGPDDSSPNEEAKAKRILDPLRWFGILTPDTLRQAQQDFQSAAINDVARVLNLGIEMEELERHIRQRRREIRERDCKPR